MGTVNFNLPAQMTNPSVWYGYLLLADASNIVISNGYYGGWYYGNNFKYTGNGVSGGTLTGYDAAINVNTYNLTYTLVYSARGFNLSASTAYKYIQSGDASGFQAWALSGNDVINGSIYSDNLLGYNGNDTMTGGSGWDWIDGGAGNDIYIISNGNEHPGAEIQDSSGTGDVVRFTSTINNDTLTLFSGDTGIDQVTISNATGATTGTTALNVDASQATTALKITGNAGNNVLIGGSAVDTLAGGAGNDTYVTNLTSSGAIQDSITESSNAGTDTVLLIGSYSGSTEASITLAANIENIDASYTGSSKLNITGNTLANTITGNDLANIINGLAGADTMIGGGGNDTYVVDNVADSIVESLGGGLDLVQSSVSYTLANYVDNLTLTGTSAINATGNTDNNTLIGNGGANILLGLLGSDNLNGGAGNDRLEGGLGNDTLTGGTGNDNFVFNTAINASSNVDTLTDFKVSGTDKIMLSKAIFAALGSATPTATGVALTATDFVSGTTVTDTSSTGQHLLYNSTSGVLYYDADGSGGNHAVQVALIGVDLHAGLLSTDFLVIA
jgi:Ca2+-binding RTX toxin-like protein